MPSPESVALLGGATSPGAAEASLRETRDGESQHFGAALFNRGEYALHELDLLAQRHPTSQRRRCSD